MIYLIFATRGDEEKLARLLDEYDINYEAIREDKDLPVLIEQAESPPLTDAIRITRRHIGVAS